MKTNKKILIIAVLFLLPAIAGAQNLVSNGDLELWDNQTTPTDWDKAENIEQSTESIHGGTYSARHTSASSSKDLMQDISGITPGSNYTITYYYYDNDPNAKTRIWSYWLDGDAYLDDNETELRPNTYSEDANEWIEYSQTLVAPANSDGFRFEVRVYHQDDNTGGYVYYDDFSITASGVNPEPTNYPEDFSAEANGLNIELDWTDATGDQTPVAYLLIGSTDQQIDPPADGFPVEDDAELADGYGALNINYGVEEAVFTNLESSTTYYFELYPYTNGGSNIDYKTDGTPPATDATSPELYVFNYENFNDTTMGDWTQLSVVGPDQYWLVQDRYGVDDSPNAKMTGYDGGSIENEDWLISPGLDATQKNEEKLEFWTATKYDGPQLKVKISGDYTGSGDPNAANWTEVDAQLSPGEWEWTWSGSIDIEDIVMDNIFYVAFQYNSTSDEAATWEIDEIMITGKYTAGIGEQSAIAASIFPNPASDIVHLNFGEINQRPAEVLVFDLNGKQMSSYAVSKGENQITIDVSKWESGLYLISINKSGGSSEALRLLVK
mgnify:CR=1 FL=1